MNQRIPKVIYTKPRTPSDVQSFDRRSAGINGQFSTGGNTHPLRTR